jgi:hypothetical protein
MLMEEPSDLYRSLSSVRISEPRMIGWAEHVSPMREREINVKFWREPLGRCPLGIPRTRWKANVKIRLRKSGYDGRRRMELTQDHAQ